MIDESTLSSLQSTLSEGKYDKATTAISRWIVGRIKWVLESRALPGQVDTAHKHSTFRVSNSDLRKHKLRSLDYFKVNIDIGDIPVPSRTFTIAGNAETSSLGNSRVIIDIKLTKHFPAGLSFDKRGKMSTAKNKSWNLFIAKLKEVLRHEIEHVDQHLVGKKYAPYPDMDSGKLDDPDVAITYFQHMQEIEAFVAGLYKRAKATKTPFSQYVDKHIGWVQFTLKRLGVKSSTIDRVAKTVRKRMLFVVKKRYPKAQI